MEMQPAVIEVVDPDQSVPRQPHRPNDLHVERSRHCVEGHISIEVVAVFTSHEDVTRNVYSMTMVRWQR
jgi:hypothetical protein